MYSRFLRSSISSPSFVFQRCLTLTSMQHAAATKLKVKEETTTPPPIPPPSSAQTDAAVTKAYSDRIHRLVEEISKLSLLDVMDLNELLKKTLKIQDVPIMASAPAAPAAKKEAEDEEENVRATAQSVFKVRLIKFDETKKVPVIKQVKDVVENINLVQAKKLVESIPQVLRDNLSKADAEKMKAKVEAVGGVCVIE